MNWFGSFAFLTTGCLLKASSAGPVAAHTKSGPRIPASQKSRSCCVIFSRISLSTVLSQPGRAAERFLQTIQTDEDRAADPSERVRLLISVWIGQDPSTTKPARIRAATNVSQASGCLLANTTTSRPSGPQCSVTRAERAGHAVFIVLLRTLFVPTKSAGVVYEFAVICVMIPFGTKGFAKCRVHFWRQSMCGSPEPHMEEVHRVRVGNGIIVRRVSDYHIKLPGNTYCRTTGNSWLIHQIWYRNSGVNRFRDRFQH